MQERVPDGVAAAQLPAVGADLIDPDLLVDCAEFDVGQAWEALCAAQEIHGSIASGTACCGRVFLEPNAN